MAASPLAPAAVDPSVGAAGENFGFLIGAHGMAGCGQYGFGLVDSTGGSVDVHYFEEANTKAGDGAYADILKCVQSDAQGVVGCTHLAASWLAQQHQHQVALGE